MEKEIHNGRSLAWAASTDIPFARDGEMECFGSGRESMISLARALGLTARSSVLLPAYVPEGLFAPFQRAGCAVTLYELDGNLDPVWPELERLLSTKARSLAVIIHYFGLRKDAERFTRLCHQHQCLAIEDLAHVLPGRDCEAGRAGDFALYSPNKVVGVPDGGVLVMRARPANLGKLGRSFNFRRPVYLAQQLCLLLLASGARRFGSNKFIRLFRRCASPFLQSYSTLMRYFEHPHRMSRLTSLLLRHADWNGWAEKRLAHARRYDSGLDRVIFKRFEGPFIRGGGPFGFPVLVGNRDGLRSHLAAANISGSILATHWDFIPEGERARHGHSVAALNGHFLMPTGQHLDTAEIDRVIRVANQWAEAQRGGCAAPIGELAAHPEELSR